MRWNELQNSLGILNRSSNLIVTLIPETIRDIKPIHNSKIQILLDTQFRPLES